MAKAMAGDEEQSVIQSQESQELDKTDYDGVVTYLDPEASESGGADGGLGGCMVDTTATDDVVEEDSNRRVLRSRKAKVNY